MEGRTKAEEKAYKRKLARDAKTLQRYEQQLRNQRKEYTQIAQAFSASTRRVRAGTAGECVLQLMDKLRELNREKTLLNGTLFWTIDEQRVKDTDGRKEFRYVVSWHVKSDEAAFTEEEIQKELKETAGRIYEETQEMFREEEDADEG